jgi:DNA modification methylase
MSALHNFISVRDELGLKLGNSKVELLDACNLESKVESSSVDGIVTSPPYSFAIDYLKGDRPRKAERATSIPEPCHAINISQGGF